MLLRRRSLSFSVKDFVNSITVLKKWELPASTFIPFQNLHFPALDFLEDVFVSLDLSSCTKRCVKQCKARRKRPPTTPSIERLFLKTEEILYIGIERFFSSVRQLSQNSHFIKNAIFGCKTFKKRFTLRGVSNGKKHTASTC